MVGDEAVKRLAAAFVFLLGTSIMHPQTSGVDSPASVTLAGLRDTHRPLLVFTPSTTPQFLTQIRALAADAYDLHDRDVTVVPLLLHEDNKAWGVTFNAQDIGVMSATEQAAARRRFHVAPDAFTVLLIGKDGGEKLRSTKPISLDTLRSTIDAMPMRQDEMRRQLKP
jgi:hypothetical protein